jgi:hypothetical protein
MSKIVEAILNKEYDTAKALMAEAVKDKVFASFVAEDAQLVPGNKVTSVDLPGSPPETDGDTVGAGEGIPADYEGKGTPETTGRGAAPIAAGDDPGSSGMDDGGVGEEDGDYGPAVVTEADKDDDDDEKMKDDDGETGDKTDEGKKKDK